MAQRRDYMVSDISARTKANLNWNVGFPNQDKINEKSVSMTKNIEWYLSFVKWAIRLKFGWNNNSPGAEFMKGLSQVLGLTFLQKYSQLKPEICQRPFVNSVPCLSGRFYPKYVGKYTVDYGYVCQWKSNNSSQFLFFFFFQIILDYTHSCFVFPMSFLEIYVTFKSSSHMRTETQWIPHGLIRWVQTQQHRDKSQATLHSNS